MTKNAMTMNTDITDSERVWNAIREAGTFTVGDVLEALDPAPTKVMIQSLIQDLRQHDMVTRVGRVGTNGTAGSWAVYRLVESPPRLPACVVVQSPAWRQQAWNAIRIQRSCTVPDMMRTFSDDVDVSYDTVYRYVRTLERAGVVLRRGRSGTPGQKGSHIVYALHPRHERPRAYTPEELAALADGTS